MRIGELARRSGVTTKAVRYYEDLGLLEPYRLPNGYRDYDDDHLRVVIEIRDLSELGITARQAAPFVECLGLGHRHGDDCVSSLTAYRDGIDRIDRIIAALRDRRDRLVKRLDESASRTFTMRTTTKGSSMTDDASVLPANLPVPHDDGAAEHLPGLPMPALALPASDGGTIDTGALGTGRTVIYLYPLTGRPGLDMPEGWDAIPGARGCTSEACDFRDHHQDLRAAGVRAVYGMSSQEAGYQAEVVDRLRLPFTMISDGSFRFADALDLPTFRAPGRPRLHARLTLVVRDGRIEHVFYPIFPPNTHAQQVLAWLQGNPVASHDGAVPAAGAGAHSGGEQPR